MNNSNDAELSVEDARAMIAAKVGALPVWPIHEAPHGTWLTKDGRALYIRDMTDSHLQNAVNYVKRQLRCHLDKDTPEPMMLAFARRRCPKLLELQAEWRVREARMMRRYSELEG